MNGIEQLFQMSLPRLIEFVLALARISGLLLIAPIFGSRIMPTRVRAALALGLAVAMLPVLQSEASAAALSATGPLSLCAGLAREAGIGFALGLTATLIVGGVQMAGQLAGIQMGIGLSNLIDPQTGEQVTALADWQNLIALLVFLSIDAHHLLIRALADSFAWLPVGGGLPAPGGLALLLSLSGGLFVIAVKIAAPVLVLILLVNAAMAVLAKLIPQLNVFIVGFPLNVGAGLLILGAAQPSVIAFLTSSFTGLGPTLAVLIRALR